MMDNIKKVLCLYAGSAAGAAAGIAAATVLCVSTPIALGIAYAVAGCSVVAAVNMDD
jgi:hypothetical protein